MPRQELSPDLVEALAMMQRTLLAVKREVRSSGPSFLLAQVVGMQLDLIERLLLNEAAAAAAKR